MQSLCTSVQFCWELKNSETNHGAFPFTQLQKHRPLVGLFYRLLEAGKGRSGLTFSLAVRPKPDLMRNTSLTDFRAQGDDGEKNPSVSFEFA